MSNFSYVCKCDTFRLMLDGYEYRAIPESMRRQIEHYCSLNCSKDHNGYYIIQNLSSMLSVLNLTSQAIDFILFQYREHINDEAFARGQKSRDLY
jgi:hypothetical protein